jgi:hypothetical protein
VVAPDRRHFLGHFRKVDHDRGVELGGETGDVAQVRGVDGVRGVRGEGRGDERVVLELRHQLLGQGDAAVGFGTVRGGEVHDGLADDRAQADLTGGAADFVFEVVHVRHRGDAALDHFDHAVQPAPAHEIAVHERLFQWEDEATQPVRHIIAEAAEHGHRRMRVCVDHARHNDVAPHIDGPVGGVTFGQRGRTHGDQGGTPDDNATGNELFPLVVEGDHVGVGQNQIDHRPRGGSAVQGHGQKDKNEG